MRRGVVRGAGRPNIVLSAIFRQRIEVLIVAVHGTVAPAHPGDGVCDRRFLAAKFRLQHEVVVLPERLGGVNVGIGGNMLAIIGAGDGRGGCDKR